MKKLMLYLIVGVCAALGGLYGKHYFDQLREQEYQRARKEGIGANATISNCQMIESKGRRGRVTGKYQQCRVEFVTREGVGRDVVLRARSGKHFSYGQSVRIFYLPEQLSDELGGYVWEDYNKPK